MSCSKTHLSQLLFAVQDLFIDPVRAGDGRTYERSAITAWLDKHDTSPMTNLPMPHKDLVTDTELLQRKWVLERRLDVAMQQAGIDPED